MTLDARAGRLREARHEGPMFPIRDHNPSQRTPYVTYALIALNVVVFLGYVGLFDSEARLGAFFDD